jgi:hypothetical protein
MATVIMQKWDGITPGQYDALRENVGWERDVPAGMRSHVASFGGGVLRMTDVWDCEELFGTFVQTRILPGLRQLGIPGQPDMIIQAAHEVTAVRRHLTTKLAVPGQARHPQPATQTAHPASPEDLMTGRVWPAPPRLTPSPQPSASQRPYGG